MFRVTLDGTILTDEPDLTGFTTQYVRDEEVKGLFLKYPNSIIFYGEGYEIIRRLFDDGVCNETTLKIEKQCTGGFRLITNGIIFVRTAVLNRSRCTVEVDIQEDTFSSRIFNNIDQKVNLGSTESKNGVVITPVPLLGGLELWSVDCGPTPCVATFETFAGAAGFAHNGTRRHIDMMHALEYLVAWMTDGEGTVQSDWYDNLPANSKYGMIEGKELRLGQDAPNTFPELSFRDIYNNFMQKTDNLFMTIEGNPGSRVLRIEDRPFFSSATEIITLNNVDNIDESVVQERLYSLVKFGSESVLESATPDFPIIPFLGHQQEQFTIQGKCDTGAELDLELGFITDSNLILDVLVNDNDAHDDKIFAIQYNSSTVPDRAHLETPLGDLKETPVYNPRWLNERIVEHYNFHGGLIKYLPGGLDNRFSAQGGSPTVVTTPIGVTNQQIKFGIDYIAPFFDTSNNYGNGTPQGTFVSEADSRYTAPADGLYTFTTTVRFNRTGGVGPTADDEVTLQIVRYDSGGTLISSEQTPSGKLWEYTINQFVSTDHSLQVEFVTFMEAGDYVEVRAVIELSAIIGSDPTYQFQLNSIFECVNIVDGGGVYTAGQPDEADLILYDFTRYIDDEDEAILMSDPVKAIGVNIDGVTNSKLYIDNVEINHATQEATWSLITNRRNIKTV